MEPAPQSNVGHQRWIVKRIGWNVLRLMLFGLLFYPATLLVGILTPTATIGWSIVFVLPYAMGALTALLIGSRNHTILSLMLGSCVTVLAILGVGALVFAEGLVCVLMVAPLWLLASVAGSASVHTLRASIDQQPRASVSILILAPFAALMADATLTPTAETFIVSRSFDIDGPPHMIWPHLLLLDELRRDEGVWNVTQDMIGVPRPSFAHVDGEGVGAIRQALWSDDVRFEEHITKWRANAELAWDFHFPDDSISRHTDRHIHPDGDHLKIKSGRYQLVPIANGRTRLTLETQYVARTPVNIYAAMWGELALGDIQNNILAIIKHRAEH